MEMISGKRILFCTDFSSNACAAFVHALEAVTRFPSSELHLLHVIPEPDAQFWKSYIYELHVDVDKMAKDVFDKRIQEEYISRLPPGIEMKTAFRIGKAAAEILKYALEINADLIVLGRQGKGAIESIFFGSIAEKVVKKSQCPVLVVP